MNTNKATVSTKVLTISLEGRCAHCNGHMTLVMAPSGADWVCRECFCDKVAESVLEEVIHHGFSTPGDGPRCEDVEDDTPELFL